MTLSELRLYLQERQQASLADLVAHFRSDPAAIDAAMQTWVRKGKAEVTTAKPECGSSCCQCKMATVTIYRWR
ncbi:MAG: FeoC-like transcriptional regulator [Saezia sp.]